jgi:acetyltransferase-like isoleucine patch superfamily enzyme/dTDP-4-dehydrorhamnose 3,5-epimerase-like enzyme
MTTVERPYFTHPQAVVETDRIGKGTRIWAFAHVLPGAVIGRDCNICDHVFVENDVVVGDRVTVKCGVQLWDGVTLEDDVFVGPNATFTNDPFPRSRQYPERFARTTVRAGASIGANATLLPGIEIGHGAMVGAGAVVTNDVPPGVVVVGNPARVLRNVHRAASAPVADPQDGPSKRSLSVGGAELHTMPVVADARGSLAFAQLGDQLPFAPKRYFVLFNLSRTAVRGVHAHRALHEFIVCTHGACRVRLDDGQRSEDVLLDSPRLGIHVPPLLWTTIVPTSSQTSLMVLASESYDPTDYVHDYDEFLALVAATRHV